MPRAPTFKIHPYAEIFPMQEEGSAREQFRQSIRDNGVRKSIVLLGDEIIDGRTRYLDACEADIPDGAIPYRQFGTEAGDGPDPFEFVIRENLERRHLTESQRAMVGAEIATMRQGERTDIAAPSANLPKVDQPTAAKIVNVSERTLRSAKAVKDKGTPGLQKAVKEGRVAVSTAEKVADLPAEEQDQLVARGEKEIVAKAKEINAKKRDIRRAVRFENIRQISANNKPLPKDRKYPVIYADPPWHYESGFSDRSVENHYPTMTVDEICALPVGDLATKDAILFMWVTIPHMMNTQRVLDAWGFKYASSNVWDKETQIMGHWFYGRHEILIVATRGSFPAPAPEAKAQSLYREKKTPKHSQKPIFYYKMIEDMTPDLPRIELFSRGGRDGWDVWGNQAHETIEAEKPIAKIERVETLPDSIKVTAKMNDDLEIPAFLRRAPPSRPVLVSVSDNKTTLLPPKEPEIISSNSAVPA